MNYFDSSLGLKAHVEFFEWVFLHIIKVNTTLTKVFNKAFKAVDPTKNPVARSVQLCIEKLWKQRTLTVGGRITVLLASSLTRLDLTNEENMLLFVCNGVRRVSYRLNYEVISANIRWSQFFSNFLLSAILDWNFWPNLLIKKMIKF